MAHFLQKNVQYFLGEESPLFLAVGTINSGAASGFWIEEGATQNFRYQCRSAMPKLTAEKILRKSNFVKKFCILLIKNFRNFDRGWRMGVFAGLILCSRLLPSSAGSINWHSFHVSESLAFNWGSSFISVTIDEHFAHCQCHLQISVSSGV